MGEVFKIAGAIIASIGSSGAIIFGLSSWLGKVWANRILEDEKKQHTLEIEDYKSKLNKEITIVNSRIDKSVYVTKLQYDKEFLIYLEIWEKLAECVITTKNLYPKFERRPPDGEELKEYNTEKYRNFIVAYNEYSNAIIKYSPFYEEKLYDGFVELRNLCNSQGSTFYSFNLFESTRDSGMNIELRNQVYIEFPKEIEGVQGALQKEIRGHLKSLQTIES